jgi:hypothetical protein
MKDSGVPDTLKTLAILNALSSGIDPLTGVPFPRDSAHQHPDVIRALFLALRAFEGTVAPAAPPEAAAPERRKASRPAAAGTPWSSEEDARLASAFDAGTDIAALAVLHDRSRFAIETRLAKLGRIPAPTGMRYPVRAEQTPKISEPLLRYAA